MVAAAVVCALSAPGISAKLFGYYGADLSSTGKYSNVYLASNASDAVAAFQSHGVPSLLSTFDVFLYYTDHVQLKVEWEAQWEAYVPLAAQLLANGTILGFNLGDELVWQCLSVANVTTVASAVRAKFPRGGAVIWYNEATRTCSAAPDLLSSCFWEV